MWTERTSWQNATISQSGYPAIGGVLIEKSQTTKGWALRVNADGQKFISDQIWEWDTRSRVLRRSSGR
jgi:hypothetical protein